jgi:hypothetical protein
MISPYDLALYRDDLAAFHRIGVANLRALKRLGLTCGEREWPDLTMRGFERAIEHLREADFITAAEGDAAIRNNRKRDNQPARNRMLRRACGIFISWERPGMPRRRGDHYSRSWYLVHALYRRLTEHEDKRRRW